MTRGSGSGRVLSQCHQRGGKLYMYHLDDAVLGRGPGQVQLAVRMAQLPQSSCGLYVRAFSDGLLV